MTVSTGTASTATITDVDVVRAVFGAFASGDLAALSDLLHADATWHHHNDDRLGGIYRGADAIIAYLTELALLTAGTLHAEPQQVMADGAGSCCRAGAAQRLPPQRPHDGRPAGRARAPCRAAGCALSSSSSATRRPWPRSGPTRFLKRRSRNMSTEQNIETARQLYAAFGHGDVRAILGRVTDDVDWFTDVAIPSAPWYGPRHGKTELPASSRPSARPGRSPSSSRWLTPATRTGTSWFSSVTHSP